MESAVWRVCMMSDLPRGGGLQPLAMIKTAASVVIGLTAHRVWRTGGSFAKPRRQNNVQRATWLYWIEPEAPPTADRDNADEAQDVVVVEGCHDLDLAHEVLSHLVQRVVFKHLDGNQTRLIRRLRNRESSCSINNNIANVAAVDFRPVGPRFVHDSTLGSDFCFSSSFENKTSAKPAVVKFVNENLLGKSEDPETTDCRLSAAHLIMSAFWWRSLRSRTTMGISGVESAANYAIAIAEADISSLFLAKRTSGSYVIDSCQFSHIG